MSTCWPALGLSAALAVNGREALLEREPFDLLLLDIHMPELDGFEVIGAIRERASEPSEATCPSSP